VELEPALPPEHPLPDNIPLVPVLESSDEAVLMVARSLLDGAGILYFVENDLLQNMLGAGRLGGGNLVTGPAVIVVREDDAADAAKLLEDLKPGWTGENWKAVNPENPPLQE
jgi:ribosomal protein L10